MLQSRKAHYQVDESRPNATYAQSNTTYSPSPNATRPSSPSKLLSTRPSTPTKPSKPEVERHPVPWSQVQWARDWSWLMYTVNIGTGAVCVCISSIPYAFKGQHALGSIFLILNIVILFLNITMTCRRMIRHPKKFLASFYDESEGIWFPAFPLALCTIILGTVAYGIPFSGPWLVEACYVAFWVYFVLAAAGGLVVQCTFRSLPRDLELVGPSECLEVFPLMLVGTLGGLLAPHLAEIDPSRALTVVLFSYIMQGLGFFMGYLKMSLWIHRHITLAKAPTKILLTYAIACGPPGFTALALVNLGNASLDIFPQTNFLGGFDGGSMDPHLIAQIFFVVGVWWSLLLMGICCWVLFVHSHFLVMAVYEILHTGYVRKFEMSWWAMTFPLAGFISTCGRFGTYFPSKTFGVINIILTCFVACMWASNLIGTVTLLWHGIVPGAPQPEEEDQKDPDAEGKGMREIVMGGRE